MTEADRHAIALKIHQGTATPAEADAYQQATTDALEAALGSQIPDAHAPARHPGNFDQQRNLSIMQNGPGEQNPVEFSINLRAAYEAKFRSIRHLWLAIHAVYGEDSISESTIKRLMLPEGYMPRNRRPYFQLKRVLSELVVPGSAE